MVIKFQTIDQYVTAAASEAQPVLQQLRNLVHQLVPESSETISYNIPAFKLQKVFIFFAAFKNHIGIYPPVNADNILVRDLELFRGEKGNLKFPLTEPLPTDLLARIVLTLRDQSLKQPSSKD